MQSNLFADGNISCHLPLITLTLREGFFLFSSFLNVSNLFHTVGLHSITVYSVTFSKEQSNK